MKKILMLVLALSISSVLAQGKGKGNDSQLERAITDEVRDELFDIDDRGNPGSGKPVNPGAHGRANAEYKKATIPGQGGGKNTGLEGELLDEIFDNDDRRGGANKKGGKNASLEDALLDEIFDDNDNRGGGGNKKSGKKHK